MERLSVWCGILQCKENNLRPLCTLVHVLFTNILSNNIYKL
jgi:hypothetical protein